MRPGPLPVEPERGCAESQRNVNESKRVKIFPTREVRSLLRLVSESRKGTGFRLFLFA
jgi:hypothetical protein